MAARNKPAALFFCLLLFFFAACGRGGEQPSMEERGYLWIGLALSDEPVLSSYAASFGRGFELGLEAVNQGLDQEARRFKALARPETQAQALAKDSRLALAAGFFTETALETAAQPLEKAGLGVILPFITDARVGEGPFFQLSPTDQEQAAALGHFARERFGGQKAAAFHSPGARWRARAQEFCQAFGQGCRAVEFNAKEMERFGLMGASGGPQPAELAFLALTPGQALAWARLAQLQKGLVSRVLAGQDLALADLAIFFKTADYEFYYGLPLDLENPAEEDKWFDQAYMNKYNMYPDWLAGMGLAAARRAAGILAEAPGRAQALKRLSRAQEQRAGADDAPPLHILRLDDGLLNRLP